MTTPHEIYQRYAWASALTRDADAVANLFTPDGVIEAPLVPAGHAFPSRLNGREQIREGLAVYYLRTQNRQHTVDVANSRYILHTTSDADVFVVEIDTAIEGPSGSTTMSLVQIFRTREGQIARLRDYFSPVQAD